MLTTADQLELLFNNEITISVSDLLTIGDNAVVGSGINVPNDMAVENKSRNTLLYTFNDDAVNVKRIQELTSNDPLYTSCYDVVGRICNPVINNAKQVSGSESKKRSLIAEAKALRAYAHFLVVNKFAKAYNPTTAEQDGGIIYMTEDKSVEDPHEPSTMAEVYRQMLADIDDAINSGALPDTQPVKTRFNLTAAYALKANILMAMQNYEEAALQRNNTLLDYYANTKQHPTWTTSVHFPIPETYYTECNPNCFDDAEQYFVIPDYWCVNNAWTEPSVAAAVEPQYGRFFLTPRCETTYAGWYEFLMGSMPEDVRPDQSQNMIGLKGWDSPNFVPAVGMVYRNTCGLNSAQMYVLLAECYVRLGDISKGMAQLDLLRRNRLPHDTFTALQGTVTDSEAAIEHIKAVSLGENMWSG